MSIQTIALSPSNEQEIFRLQFDIGVEIIKNIRNVLLTSGINFTDDLAGSFQLEIINGKAAVQTQNAYASFVDKGISGGGGVNFDALYDWVSTKLGIAEPDLTPVTWAIVNKIQNKGIKPTRFVKKALKAFISNRGVASVKKGGKRGKVSRSAKILKKVNKALTKINKTIKKINKTIKKTSKNINRVYKPIRRYK